MSRLNGRDEPTSELEGRGLFRHVCNYGRTEEMECVHIFGKHKIREVKSSSSVTLLHFHGRVM